MIGVCTDDGECVGSPELRLLRRNLRTVTSGIGRDTHARLREQAQVKSKDRRAKTECQNRKEWGHHVPNHRVMGTSTEDRARSSHTAVHCQVEEQALVEQGAEVES